MIYFFNVWIFASKRIYIFNRFISKSKVLFFVNGSSINNVTRCWTIFDLSSPLLINYLLLTFYLALVLSSQKFLSPPFPITMTSFFDNPKGEKERRNWCKREVWNNIEKRNSYHFLWIKNFILIFQKSSCTSWWEK